MSMRDEFIEWWESRHYDEEDKEVKKAAWAAWQAAQAPASNEKTDNTATLYHALERIDELEKELAAAQAPASGKAVAEPFGADSAYAVAKEAGKSNIVISAELVVELIEALRAATSPASAVPEGWKLVPIDSTSEMDIAGMDGLYNSHDGYVIDRGDADAVWSAMIAAAPQPPKQEN